MKNNDISFTIRFARITNVYKIECSINFMQVQDFKITKYLNTLINDTIKNTILLNLNEHNDMFVVSKEQFIYLYLYTMYSGYVCNKKFSDTEDLILDHKKDFYFFAYHKYDNVQLLLSFLKTIDYDVDNLIHNNMNNIFNTELVNMLLNDELYKKYAHIIRAKDFDLF